MKIDEEELEAAHAIERRLCRDDEREHVARKGMRKPKRPTYSRFRTLARIHDAIEASMTTNEAFEKEAA